MTTKTDETKRARDYSREHKIRKKRNKRLLADVNRDKGERFIESIEARGLTFARWLDKKMSEELEAE